MKTNLNRSNDVVWEEVGEKIVLVSPATGARLLLDSAASAFWKLCDGTRNAAELAAKLALSGTEIAEFSGSFERMGLLQTAGSGARMFSAESFRSGTNFRVLSLGTGGRKRPNPRGISGPA